ncbi:MAG: deoxyguanosinetriphosphate triphosphohydrolase [Chloroflexi bacterium]|nr:deoxyguanosinetriphosphate triphosphohydrolase [Chloroflexota bacterium]
MVLNREQLEDNEALILADYAALSRNQQGRLYPESESSYRTAFQRDRDRIIHSAAFRRLEYKTQVFANDEGDYYRTRLTHTLEVAQIARTMARALRANEDLVEAICLGHDLGHPPFGHSGEDTLNKLMQDHGGFNHNYQSYRVVTELERRYPQFTGLNLTRDTLFGLAKHETDYNLSERAGLDPKLRGTLEAQIANITDELAYNAHDLDDGLNAGLIEPGELAELEIWRLLCDRLGYTSYPTQLDEIARHEFIRELVGVFVDDVLVTTTAQLEEVKPTSPRMVQEQGTNLVCYSGAMHSMEKSLKAFLYENMYYSFRVVRMKRRAERFIEQIFTTLVADPRQLPKECHTDLKTYPLHRVVADYIASMTDRSAVLEYRRLFDPLMRP